MAAGGAGVFFHISYTVNLAEDTVISLHCHRPKLIGINHHIITGAVERP